MGIQCATPRYCQSLFLESFYYYERSTKVSKVKVLWNYGVRATIWVLWMERNKRILMMVKMIVPLCGRKFYFNLLDVSFKRNKKLLSISHQFLFILVMFWIHVLDGDYSFIWYNLMPLFTSGFQIPLYFCNYYLINIKYCFIYIYMAVNCFTQTRPFYFCYL